MIPQKIHLKVNKSIFASYLIDKFLQQTKQNNIKNVSKLKSFLNQNFEK
jgi:hypothetical protein